jgi:hypothetical protein
MRKVILGFELLVLLVVIGCATPAKPRATIANAEEQEELDLKAEIERTIQESINASSIFSAVLSIHTSELQYIFEKYGYEDSERGQSVRDVMTYYSNQINVIISIMNSEDTCRSRIYSYYDSIKTDPTSRDNARLRELYGFLKDFADLVRRHEFNFRKSLAGWQELKRELGEE